MVDALRRSSSFDSGFNKNSVVLTVPTGSANGEGQIVDIVTSNPTTVITATTPSGWTLIDTVLSTTHGGYETRQYTYKCRFVTGDGTVTVNLSGSAEQALGIRTTYQNVKSTGDFVGSTTTNSGNSQTTTATGFTALAGSCAHFMGHDWWGVPGLAPPTNYTERHDLAMLYVADRAGLIAGSTGDPAQTNSNTDPGQPFRARLIEILADPETRRIWPVNSNAAVMRAANWQVPLFLRKPSILMPSRRLVPANSGVSILRAA